MANTNMTDKQTYEVESTLPPLTKWPYSDALYKIFG
jgi:hypothetical protein